MAKFVPREKLSKKARKELDSKRRTLWPYSPATTRIESQKLYNRKKNSHARYDETGMGVCWMAGVHQSSSDRCVDVKII